MTVTTGARVTTSSARASSASSCDQLFLEAAHLDLGAELAGEHRRRVGVERGVDGHHQPLHQQLREHVLDAHVELVGEILDRHAFRERDRARDRRRRRRASAATSDAARRAAGRRRTLARRRAGYGGRDGMPGRCGYWPGRGGRPGCWVRIGCDGSGRGPPGGAVAARDDAGYGGRGAPAGRAVGCAGGRTPAVPRLSRSAGRRRARPPARRPAVGSWRRRPRDARAAVPASAAAASASSAAVLRCAAEASAARCGPASASAWARPPAEPRRSRRLGSSTGGGGPAGFRRRRPRAAARAAAHGDGGFDDRLGGASGSALRPAAVRRPPVGSISGCGLGCRRRRRPAALTVLTSRGGGSAGAAGFGGSAPSWPARRLLALGRRRLGEDVAARQRDVALPREAVDELPRHDLFDRARRALHLDAVIALEQRRHFLARRPEQLRDLVNPNSCQRFNLCEIELLERQSLASIGLLRLTAVLCGPAGVSPRAAARIFSAVLSPMPGISDSCSTVPPRRASRRRSQRRRASGRSCRRCRASAYGSRRSGRLPPRCAGRGLAGVACCRLGFGGSVRGGLRAPRTAPRPRAAFLLRS